MRISDCKAGEIRSSCGRVVYNGACNTRSYGRVKGLRMPYLIPWLIVVAVVLRLQPVFADATGCVERVEFPSDRCTADKYQIDPDWMNAVVEPDDIVEADDSTCPEGYHLDADGKCIHCPPPAFFAYDVCIYCPPGYEFDLEMFKCRRSCFEGYELVELEGSGYWCVQQREGYIYWPQTGELVERPPNDGGEYQWDEVNGIWWKCPPDYPDYVPELGLCCSFAPLYCYNISSMLEVSQVVLPSDVRIEITETSGKVEYSADGGRTWTDVEAGDQIPPGSVLRTGPFSSARWDRVYEERRASIEGGYYEVCEGALEIYQLGTCAGEQRCGASTEFSRALIREVYPNTVSPSANASSIAYVGLRAEVSLQGRRVKYSNLAGSEGTIDTWPLFGPDSGIVTSLAPGVTTSYQPSGSPVPTLTEWGMIIFTVMLFGYMAWVITRRRQQVNVGV